LIVLAISLGFFMVGCVGGNYNSPQTTKENLLKLKKGMRHEKVRVVMGDPPRIEGRSWGTTYFYRTGSGNDPNRDYTPIVFDNKGIVIGWGRGFYNIMGKSIKPK